MVTIILISIFNLHLTYISNSHMFAPQHHVRKACLPASSGRLTATLCMHVLLQPHLGVYVCQHWSLIL